MPDILIRGMEMPKEGGKILIAADGSVWVNAWPTRGYMRMENVYAVPLPEGHGRGIDADALMEIIRAHDYPLTAHFNSTDNGMFTLGIQQAVNEAPTIVPADVTDNYVGSKSEEGETNDSKL